MGIFKTMIDAPSATTATSCSGVSTTCNHSYHVSVINNTSEALRKENDEYARNLIPAMLFVGILMVTSFVGNALVIYVYGFRFKTATQHTLIVCLACFDFLMTCISMPTEIADMRLHHLFSSAAACKLLRFITVFCSISSSLTLLTIALDRHRRITKPLARQMSVKRARILELASVTGSVCLSWPTIVFNGLRSTTTSIPGLSGKDCSHIDDSKLPLIYNSILGCGFFVVISVLAFLYFQIWKTAKNHMSVVINRSAVPTSGTSLGDLRNETGEGLHPSCEIRDGSGTPPNGSTNHSDVVNMAVGVTSSSVKVRFSKDVSSLSSHEMYAPETPMKRLSDKQICFSEVGSSNSHLQENGGTDFHDKTRDIETVINYNTASCSDQEYLYGKVPLRSRRTKSLSDNSIIRQIVSAKNSILRLSISDCGKQVSNTQYTCPADYDVRHIQLSAAHLLQPAHSDILKPGFMRSNSEPSFYLTKGYIIPVGQTGSHSPRRQNSQYSKLERSIKSNNGSSEAKATDDLTYIRDAMHTVKIYGGRNLSNSAYRYVSPSHSSRSSNNKTYSVNLGIDGAGCKDLISMKTNKHEMETRDKGMNLLVENEKCMQIMGDNFKHQLQKSFSCYSPCDNFRDHAHNNADVTPVFTISFCGLTSSDRVCEQTPCDRLCEQTSSDRIQSSPRTPVQCSDFSHLSEEISQQIMDNIDHEKVCQSNQPADRTNMTANLLLAREVTQDVTAKSDSNNQAADSSHDTNTSTLSFRHLEAHQNIRPDSCSSSSSKNSNYNTKNRRKTIDIPTEGLVRYRIKSVDDISVSNKSSGSRLSKHLDKTTIVAFAISSVFVISFLPYLALMSVRGIVKNFDYNLSGASLCVYNIFVRFYFLNSAANPLMYGMLNKRFRQECKRLLFYLCQSKLKNEF